MTDEEKDSPSKRKEGPKRVSLSEHIEMRNKYKEKISQLEGQLEESNGMVSSLKAELSVVDEGLEDGEKAKKIREYLHTTTTKLEKEKADLSKKVASLTERERRATIKELVANYRSRGLEVDAETLEGEENPELKIRDLYIEHLSQRDTEKEETDKEEDSDIIETGPVSSKIVDVSGLDPNKPSDREKFLEMEKSLQAKAVS